MRKINKEKRYKKTYKLLAWVLFPFIKLAGLVYFLVGKSWPVFKKLNRGYWERIGGNKKFLGWRVFFKEIPKIELFALPAYLLLGIGYFVLMAVVLINIVIAPAIWLGFLGSLWGDLGSWIYIAIQVIWFGVLVDYQQFK